MAARARHPAWRPRRTRPQRPHLGSIALLLVAIGALAVGACTSAPPAAAPETTLIPENGILFGAYVDPEGRWVDNEFAMRQVTMREAQLGRTLAIQHHYYAWTDVFPSGLEEWALSKGRIPLISWAGTRLTTILGGGDDEMIRHRAEQVAALGKPVFLRWGWEMNGNWSEWDGANNSEADPSVGPSRYVDAWRHIHGIFEGAGATNVVWVWSPNAEDLPRQAWNHWTRYYPGDEYVDWVGMDGYNWGTKPGYHWTSFEDVFAPLYTDYAARKPIMIAETASAEPGGSKGAWIAAAAATIKTTFPSIRAFVYFDVGGGVDWRADSSDDAFRAYRAMAADPYFNGKPPGT